MFSYQYPVQVASQSCSPTPSSLLATLRSRLCRRPSCVRVRREHSLVPDRSIRPGTNSGHDTIEALIVPGGSIQRVAEQRALQCEMKHCVLLRLEWDLRIIPACQEAQKTVHELLLLAGLQSRACSPGYLQIPQQAIPSPKKSSAIGKFVDILLA